MIGVQTELQVADNTGAKRIECIKVLGGSKRRYASIGDTIVIAVKEAMPKGKVKKGSVHKAVVVRVKKGIHRNDGSKVRFDNNAAVLVDDKGEPVGTSLNASSGGVNIYSEPYTMYNLTAEELSAKGNGGRRQLYNYVSANEDIISIYTPPDTYTPDKVESDVTVDNLQQQRMDEIQGQQQAFVPKL